MISVRGWGWSWSGHELTDILLTGENTDMDIQENVRTSNLCVSNV